jgi:hypothetical protein
MTGRNGASAYGLTKSRQQACRRRGRSPSVVVLELDGRCDLRRLRGRVEHVSVTGAWATVAGTVATRRIVDVPLDAVEAFAFAAAHAKAPELERVR